MITRLGYSLIVGSCVSLLCVAPDVSAAVTRSTLHAAGLPADASVTMLEIGAETRPLFASSGRRTLAIQPVDVGAGGRLFTYGPVPAESAGSDFTAEVLVWEFPRAAEGERAERIGGWRRVAVTPYKAATGQTVSATIVDPTLDTGPIITGVYARFTEVPDGRVSTSEPVEIPRGARLRFAYGIDELDTRSLAPVTVTVTAVLVDEESEAAERVEIFRRALTPSTGSPGWTDLTVDLGKLSGDRVAFEFRSQSKVSADELSTHIAWATPALLHETRGKPAPTVVLVSLGNVRARSMSCCGATQPTTPFLDGLFGSEGVICQRALTEAVDSVSSHMSLLTGKSPCSHGVRSGRRQLDPQVRTLAERFSAAGYATSAFTDGGGLVSELGFSRGFDVFLERAGTTFKKALSWLESRDGEPVFLFIQSNRAATDLGTYESAVRQLDDELRGFMVQLDQLIDPDHLIVAITSGYGEEFLEHGALGHGTHLFEESVRVPMLLRGGGVKAGFRPAALFGTIDVAPTLLQLAGQQAPTDVEGIARGDELRAGMAWSTEMRFIEATASERRLENGLDPRWRAPGYAVVEGPLKLIRDGASSDYLGFNVAEDAAEHRNLLAEAPVANWVPRLREAMDAHAAGCEGPLGEPAGDVYLSPDSRMELRDLGYPD